MLLEREVARVLAGDGIGVNAIAPSRIDADVFRTSRRGAARAAAPGHTEGRLGQARDVAGVCLFLASDLTSQVAGAVVDANGGPHIH